MSTSLKIDPNINLPSLSLSLPSIVFGGASLSGSGGGYGFGEISQMVKDELLSSAFEAGIKAFDTAPIYGFGESEKTLGTFFKSKREKVIFISKSGVDWHDTKRVNMTNDPETTQKMLDQSLINLQTDYIDIYMIHWPDPKIDIRVPMEVLKKNQDTGKIKAIGLCNTNLSDLNKASEVAQVDIVQSEFNLFSQKDFDPALKEKILKAHIPFMGWGPLDKGILNQTVGVNRSFDSHDARSWAPWWNKKTVEKKIQLVQAWSHYFDAHESILSFLIKDYFNHPFYKIWLAGCKNKDQLNSLMTAFKNPMPDNRHRALKNKWLELTSSQDEIR